MDNIQGHLKDLSEIRSLMERSSKFLSLSGLSGISAGIVALIGATFAYFQLHSPALTDNPRLLTVYGEGVDRMGFLSFFFLDSGLVLVSALVLAWFFSRRLAKRKNLPMWNATAKRTLVALAIPLLAGGIFCLIQLSWGFVLFIAPSMLLFYGLALLNASQFTHPEIRLLGISEIVLGLMAAWWVGHGLLFWAFGFGILHIVYGSVMYFRYER